MTLIANEIYLDKGTDDPVIISYADNRLTIGAEKNPKKKYPKGKKLFRIEYLNATVSFWGLANVQNAKGGGELLCTWLPNFIRHQHSAPSLMDFANRLRDEINLRTYKQYLVNEPSGFHLAGIRADGVPEFIHFSNCDYDPLTASYYNMKDQFKEPFHDFLNRDAVKYGWDGSNPNSFKYTTDQNPVYRNGHIIVHGAVWDSHMHSFRQIFTFPGFTAPQRKSDAEIKKMYRHMLTYISVIYDNWASVKIVGAPWDIEVIRKK